MCRTRCFRTGIILAAVVDRDDLIVRRKRLKRLVDCHEIFVDVFAFVIGRHDDAEHSYPLGSRFSRYFSTSEAAAATTGESASAATGETASSAAGESAASAA